MSIINALKPTNLKAVFTRTAIAGALAGAAMLATPTANAQVAIGIHFGHRPVYVAPAPFYAPPVYAGPAFGYGYPGPRVVYDRRWHDRRYWR